MTKEHVAGLGSGGFLIWYQQAHGDLCQCVCMCVHALTHMLTHNCAHTHISLGRGFWPVLWFSQKTFDSQSITNHCSIANISQIHKQRCVAIRWDARLLKTSVIKTTGILRQWCKADGTCPLRWNWEGKSLTSLRYNFAVNTNISEVRAENPPLHV